MAQSSSQTLNMGASHSRVQQSGGKRSKARHAESRARPVSSIQPAATVVHHSGFSGDQSQPIVISDTPSPAVSIITIHSDTEDEDDRKIPPASVDQRANVISCVTVHDSHDSDSSTSSPLSPKRLPNFVENPSHLSKSTAVVMPSVKSQPGESSSQDPATDTSGKAKKGSAGQSNRSVACSSERHQRRAPSRTQPLNLSQVQQAAASSQECSESGFSSSSSLRRQPSFPPSSSAADRKSVV